MLQIGEEGTGLFGTTDAGLSVTTGGLMVLLDSSVGICNLFNGHKAEEHLSANIKKKGNLQIFLSGANNM